MVLRESLAVLKDVPPNQRVGGDTRDGGGGTVGVVGAMEDEPNTQEEVPQNPGLLVQSRSDRDPFDMCKRGSRDDRRGTHGGGPGGQVVQAGG